MADIGRRPVVVVLSRDAVIPRHGRALVAPCTTTIRGLASEVVLEPADDPVPLRSAVNLDSIQGVPPHVRAKIPSQVARDLSALPIQLRDDAKTLVVAMSEPQNLSHIDTLRSVSRCRILPQIAGRSSIARAFGRFYEGEADPSDLEGSFKFVDAQGNTVVKQQDQVSKSKPTAPSAPDSGPPPCAFPQPAAAANLYALTPGAAQRADHVHPPPCAGCALRDRCPGVPRAYLARDPSFAPRPTG